MYMYVESIYSHSFLGVICKFDIRTLNMGLVIQDRLQFFGEGDQNRYAVLKNLLSRMLRSLSVLIVYRSCTHAELEIKYIISKATRLTIGNIEAITCQLEAL